MPLAHIWTRTQTQATWVNDETPCQPIRTTSLLTPSGPRILAFQIFSQMNCLWDKTFVLASYLACLKTSSLVLARNMARTVQTESVIQASTLCHRKEKSWSNSSCKSILIQWASLDICSKFEMFGPCPSNNSSSPFSIQSSLLLLQSDKVRRRSVRRNLHPLYSMQIFGSFLPNLIFWMARKHHPKFIQGGVPSQNDSICWWIMMISALFYRYPPGN